MPVKLQMKDMAQSSWLAESIDGFSLDKPGVGGGSFHYATASLLSNKPFVKPTPTPGVAVASASGIRPVS